MLDDVNPAALRWQRSSVASGATVEVAFLPDGHVAVRDSKAPDAGHLVYDAGEWDAFVTGVLKGEFDDLG